MISLDHVGIIGDSIKPLRRAWQERGFFVTEPEELMALDPSSHRRVSLGQHSCHIILERGYIELTAVDPITPQHHLFPWIRADVALAIIAIGTEEIEGTHRRLLASPVPVGSIAQASRPIHYGARRGDALFSWFALGAASTPEALVCFVRNERPELIYQPEVQQHPNGAQALESIVICSNQPAVTALRYSNYAASPVEQVAPGLLRCTLQAGCIWIGTSSALSRQFGNQAVFAIGDTPRAVGFGVTPAQMYWI
jgi:hypothetical protein